MVEQKTIFVTAGAKNTGYAIAEHFAKNGYCVALSSRNMDAAKKAAAKISAEFSVKAEGYELDLLYPDEIEKVFANIKNDFGRLDIFVANAAHLGVDFDIFNTSVKDYDEIMNTNVRGTFFCCRQAALIMREQKYGSIVIMGSVQYKGGIWGRTVYSTSKGALASLTRNLAFELGQYNIRANIVVAGAIHTDRWDKLTEDKAASRRVNYPLGREASMQEIANAVFYLGTDLSGSVTGIDLLMDSGLMTCLLPYAKNDCSAK